MNEQNLISAKDRTPEERKEIGRKGGIASGEARRARKLWRDELDRALQKVVKSINGEDVTQNAIAMDKLAEKCAKGDLHAITIAARILGEFQAPES